MVRFAVIFLRAFNLCVFAYCVRQRIYFKYKSIKFNLLLNTIIQEYLIKSMAMYIFILNKLTLYFEYDRFLILTIKINDSMNR